MTTDLKQTFVTTAG